MFELAKDVVSKNLIVFKVFLEKIFELSSYYEVVLSFEAIFILLMLLLNNYFTKK